MGLTVQKEIQDQNLTLYIKGVLDISTAHVFHGHFNEIGNFQVLTIDFSYLEFIDSSSIGEIIDLIYLSQEKNIKLVFKGMNDFTNHLFETVGLYEILKSIQGEVV
ncbi:STAS domain-containing protein [Aeribacillus sp. FSL M8-0254]|uniref:STAS domain-containing protein n=1 Tax=Aeribacillus sp. FSL M8-0254 TaxID=2954577 RepID=UPI0030F70E15